VRKSGISKKGIMLVALTLLASLFYNANVFAEISDPESLEVKARLEDLISTRLRSALATSIDKSLFEVSVQVLVIKNKNANKVTETPAVAAAPIQDFQKFKESQGSLMNAEELIKRYEEQLQSAAKPETPLNVPQKNYQSAYIVKSVDVVIGVSEDLGKDYSETLRTWLSNRVDKEFGQKGKVSLQTIKAKPKPIEQKVIVPPENKVLKYVGGLQNLFGLLFFSISVIIAVILWRKGHSEVASEDRKFKLQIFQAQSSQSKSLASSNAKKDLEKTESSVAVNIDFEMKSLEALICKIAYITTGLQTDLRHVLIKWLESGERGQFKVACLMDAIAGINGLASMQGPIPSSKIHWNTEIPDEYKTQMQGTFKKMSSLSISLRRKILEEVYWDLTTIKHIGEKAVNEPFSFVGQLETSSIKSLLNEQSPQVRALAVLHMPFASQEKYISELNPEARESLLVESLNLDKLQSSEIELASEHLKSQASGLKDATGIISVKPMAFRLLESLNILEEIEFLKNIAKKVSDQGLSIKQNFPSLAFIGEYPEEKLRLFIQNSPAEELVEFLKVMPELKEQITPLCKARVISIIENDLSREDRTSKEDKMRNLVSLKSRLVALIDEGQISLAEIFKLESRREDFGQGGTTHAA
jgi:flagellar motor switch protein FliG